MGKGSFIGMRSIWVQCGYRSSPLWVCVLPYGQICNPLNLVNANRTIDKVISNPRTNGLFLTCVFDAGKNILEDIIIRYCHDRPQSVSYYPEKSDIW